MTRAPLRVLTALAVASSQLAIAQTATAQTSTAHPTSAYIYVSSNYSGDHNRVVGYAAAPDGRLTEIAGSPWADDVSSMATTGSYLFGVTNISTDHGKNIFSYKVESNGALKYVGANNIEHTAPGNVDNQAAGLLLDYTGSDLYVFTHYASNANGGPYESFAIDKTTGLLNYLGATDPVDVYAYPLTMLADDLWAFSPEGEEGDGSNSICAYKRTSTGALAFSSGKSVVECRYARFPGLESGQFFSVVADPTNHLAVAVVIAGASDVEIKIATLAVNTTTGAWSSNSNAGNMPASDVQLVLNQLSLVMAPSGKLLAVGGGNGIQIYSFNPRAQAAPITGLITRAPITAMYWDKSNHLYAISNADNTLHVFTVTATEAEEAPGSPYTIPHPVAITGHSF